MSLVVWLTRSIMIFYYNNYNISLKFYKLEYYFYHNTYIQYYFFLGVGVLFILKNITPNKELQYFHFIVFFFSKIIWGKTNKNQLKSRFVLFFQLRPLPNPHNPCENWDWSLKQIRKASLNRIDGASSHATDRQLVVAAALP